MPNDITDEVVYFAIYNTRHDDEEAKAAIIALGSVLDDEMLIELEATLVDDDRQAEDEGVVCCTRIGTNGEHIVTGVVGAGQQFGVIITYMEENDISHDSAVLLLTMLEEGRLKFSYWVLSENYPFDEDEDIPPEVDHDALGNRRNSFITSFPVHFVNGRFEFPPDNDEEDDPDEDDGEGTEEDADDSDSVELTDGFDFRTDSDDEEPAPEEGSPVKHYGKPVNGDSYD